MFDRKKIWAYVHLVWNMLIHLLLKPFRFDREGFEKFERKYGPDGIYALARRDRETMAERMQCIGCGRCDDVCPVLLVPEGAAFAGPAAHAMGFGRTLVDLPVHLDQVDCTRCGACTPACPVAVPLEEMFAALRERLARKAWDSFPAETAATIERLRETGTVDGEGDRLDATARGSGKRLLFECGCRPGGGLEPGTVPGIGAGFRGCCGALAADLGGGPIPHTAVDAVIAAVEAAGAREVVAAEPRCYRAFIEDDRYRAAFEARLLLEELPDWSGPSGDSAIRFHPGSDLAHHLRNPGLLGELLERLDVKGVPLKDGVGGFADSGISGAGAWARRETAAAMARRLLAEASRQGGGLLLAASGAEAAFLRAQNRHENLKVRDLASWWLKSGR